MVRKKQCTALPSENEPADEYAATRQTVRNTIDMPANEGLLRRAAGKGVRRLFQGLCRKAESRLQQGLPRAQRAAVPYLFV
ncbi:MAG: GntR family transcriptional regulator [Eubacteriales bacterium]|nr:GntR family transcriptional regulator [Eubacteriales bacterium]